MAAVAVLLPSGTLATGGGDGCSPGRTPSWHNSQVGWSQSNGGASVGGAYANILNYSPWVYPNSSVSAWSMLTAGSEFAQVGWVEYAYGARYDFYEVYDNTKGNVYQNLNPEPINNTTDYNVMWQYNGANTVTVVINGANQYSNTLEFDAIPTGAQQAGEIHNIADQVPGAYLRPEDFSSANIWINGWVAFNGALYREFSWENYAKYSSTHVQIGDAACTGD